MGLLLLAEKITMMGLIRYLFYIFLFALNSHAQYKIPKEKKEAKGLILYISSKKSFKGEKFNALLKEHSLKKKRYLSHLKLIDLKLQKSTRDFSSLISACKDFIALNGIEDCKLNLSIQLDQSEEEDEQGDDCADCKEKELGRNQIIKKIQSRVSQNCELFEKSKISGHPEGLSLYWAQEYTGADLLRKRIEETKPILIPPNNLFAIWDSSRTSHGDAVSNLIMGPEKSSLIPAEAPLDHIDIQYEFDYLKAIDKVHNLFSKKQFNRVPHYINNSMCWESKDDGEENNNDSADEEFKIGEKISELIEETNIVFVTSSGNNWGVVPPQKRKAAKDNKMILVSSFDPDGKISSFSNISAEITVAAPSGNYIATRYVARGMKHFGGTSGAAPQVTAALSAFELISGYKLNTEESKRLLERTALKMTDLPVPNSAGAGTLNSYLIGEIAFKLKKRCKKNLNCIRKKLKKNKTYKRKNTKLNDRELSKYFPECSQRLKKNRKNSSLSCRDKKNYLDKLRRLAFTSKNPELWGAVACISKLDKKTANAQYYEKLKKADNLSHESISKQIKEMKVSDKDLIKYILSHEKGAEHSDILKRILKESLLEKEINQFLIREKHWEGNNLLFKRGQEEEEEEEEETSSRT